MTARALVNHELRSSYVVDCEKGLRRWNRILDEFGITTRFTLPHVGFNRQVGAFAGHRVSPDGRIVGAAEWEANEHQWLPTDAERMHVRSLMHYVDEPGRMAGWIAPPSSGINTRPVEYEYVKV